MLGTGNPLDIWGLAKDNNVNQIWHQFSMYQEQNWGNNQIWHQFSMYQELNGGNKVTSLVHAIAEIFIHWLTDWLLANTIASENIQYWVSSKELMCGRTKYSKDQQV